MTHDMITQVVRILENCAHAASLTEIATNLTPTAARQTADKVDAEESGCSNV